MIRPSDLHARMRRVGLAFDGDEERHFLRSFVLGEFRRTQVAMLLGIGVYYGFTAWDRVIDPSAWTTTHLIRLAVVGLVLLPITLLTLVERARARAEWFFLVYATVPSVSLSVIYALLDRGFDHGAAGIVIVILFVSTLLPMRVPFFVAFGAATWTAFAVCEPASERALSGLSFVNNLYVGTSLLLGTYAIATREWRARARFRAAGALREAKERTEAALAELGATRQYLVQAEKIAALGHLVTGVAHEINTPLGLAMTTATTLEVEAGRLATALAGKQLRQSDLVGGLDRMREGTRLLADNLRRAGGLVDSFRQIDVDRVSETRRRFGLRGCLDDLSAGLTSLLREKGHRLVVECADGIAIDSYPDTLSGVLRTLVLNALAHAYPDGQSGRITLTASVAEMGATRIAVADDGRGIAPADLGRVFDPFFTTARHAGGMGLGLHIAHNLVAVVLNGQLRADSEVGRGTRFTIDLPAIAGERSPSPRSGEAAHA